MSKSVSSQIESHFEKQVFQNFREKSFFIAGISGGADSMVLLYLMTKIKADAFVVHINYGTRGAESDKDQELVENIAFEWGFECCSVKLNTKALKTGNFQKWARDQRYQVFEDFKDELKADAIVVAHHQNDQIETILQKILRGGSPETWSGMEVLSGNLFRPLLEFSKEDIIKYCNENAIPFREDKSNADDKYARNFIRGEFSNKMNALFPGWQQNVLKLSDYGKLTSQILSQVEGEYFSEGRLHIPSTNSLSKFELKAVIKRFLDQYDITYSSGVLSEFKNLMGAETGSELILNERQTVIKDREFISFKNSESEFRVNIDRSDLAKGFVARNLVFSISEKPGSGLYLDLDSVRFPITIRTWENGDRFQPLGMKGSQKVSDHLTNRKVSSAKKSQSLVIQGADSTIYTVLFNDPEMEMGSISELCKATQSTKQYLLIENN